MKKPLVLAILFAVVAGAGVYFGTDWVRPIPSFRVYVDGDAVYRLTWQQLADAGMPYRSIPAAKVRLTHRGTAVPVRVVSEDERFGRGDWLEFRGERLEGSGKFHHGYSHHNVYQLAFEGEPSPIMRTVPATARPAARPEVATTPQTRLQHFEVDKLMIRLNARELPKDVEEPELWFWHKLTHIDRRPFFKDLDLSDIDLAADGTVDLTIRFHALSKAVHRRRRDQDLPPLPDHQVDITLNGEPLGSAQWDGKKAHVVEIEDIDTSRFVVGPNRLELSVPKRVQPGEEEPWVDVVMLDWVDLRYPRLPNVGAPYRSQILADLAVDGIAPETVLHFVSEAPRVTAFGDSGTWIEAADLGPAPEGDGQVFAVPVLPEDRSYRVVAGAAYGTPAVIEVDRPSDLRADTNRADYLMIAHRTLLGASERLAEFHRDRGLDVALIDVQDIYDEWNGGIVHPRAIRDFIAYAQTSWTAPAPRFVLFVGDASWDTKNNTADDANYANWVNRELLAGQGRFVDNTDRGVARYEGEATASMRALIPTWSFASFEGHSASDNFFAATQGDDMYPDIAVGRFPVIDPAEVDAIVDKTIDYLERAKVGPWKRKIVWITNEEPAFQRRTDRSARMQQERGFEAVKIYPQKAEDDNTEHQDALQEAFDDGQLIVHFFGHGGRHIWRTGPPDFKKNHDLFTLDHVDALEPNERLPMVLSMTCYSAPFDHPTADSIGEKFLRVEDRGAVAVFAASWRNNPTPQFSEQVVEELTTPGATIGEAIMRAKQGVPSPTLVQTYNLLGDPALTLALPALPLEISPTTPDDVTDVVATIPEHDHFRGQAIVDWIDGDGTVVHTVEVAVENGRAHAAIDPSASIDPASVEGVQVYVWNDRRGIDGAGFLGAPVERAAAEAGTTTGAGG